MKPYVHNVWDKVICLLYTQNISSKVEKLSRLKKYGYAQNIRHKAQLLPIWYVSEQDLGCRVQKFEEHAFFDLDCWKNWKTQTFLSKLTDL